MTTVRVRDSAELGDSVREARQRLGWSQADLAAAAGVGRQWLVGFEAGDKPSAPLDMVFRVLQQLDVDVTLDATPPARRTSRVPRISADEIRARYEDGARR